LRTEATKLHTKVSSYGKLQSSVSSLRDAAVKLTNPSTWNATASTSSDSAAVNVTTDSTAATGSYSIAVNALASSQSTVSTIFSSAGSVIGIGTMHIELGSWNDSQTTFTTNPNWPKSDVVLGEGDNTLEKVRDKINAANAGVIASVVTDATGSRLVLRSSSTGAENGFKITTSDADGNDTDKSGLSALAFDPSAGLVNMSRTQAAANAKVTINGLAVTSATNTFTGVVQGMTFQVGKTTGSNPVDVTVKQDTDAMNKAVTDFATAYTNLNKLVKDQTKYDATSKTSSPLQGDQTVNSVLSGARSILSQTFGGSGSYHMLTDIGLSVDATGGLTVNSSKLTAAISGHQADVKALFSNLDDATPGNMGMAQRFKTFTDSMLSIDGAISTRTDGLQKAISNNSKQQTTMEARIAQYKARLLAQYNALDTTMAKLNGTSNYVTQQIKSMSTTSA
jgi:flagellar hook-associated protein 2